MRTEVVARGRARGLPRTPTSKAATHLGRRPIHTHPPGSLPDAWANLPALETLDLSHNHITGPLPKDWARLLGRAKTIFVARNRLSGSIPPEWGGATSNSKNFWRFDARQNRKLTGCLPRGMERFAHTTSPFASLYFDGTGIDSVC